MSVNKTEYVVVGVNVIEQINKMNDEDFERLEINIEKSDEIEMIYDGMSGEYCIIGSVLREADENGDSNLVSIDYINLDDITQDVNREFARKLLGVIEWHPSDIELIAFSHYH